MTDSPHKGRDPTTAGSEAERIVEQRIRVARKEEIVSLYEDLLKTIWDRLVPTLGRVSVAAIMERSLGETTKKYPFMKSIEISREGLSADSLQHIIESRDPGEIRSAMKELVAVVVDLLAVLTGDIIVRRLLSEIQESPQNPSSEGESSV